MLISSDFSISFSQRSWEVGPRIGTQLSVTNNGFIILGVIIYIARTAYLWYGFPFDNACQYNGNDKSDILLAYNGVHSVQDLEGNKFPVNITSQDEIYSYCTQSLFGLPPLSFLFPQSEDNDGWMSQEQVTIVYIFAVTLVIGLVVISLDVMHNFFQILKRTFLGRALVSCNLFQIVYDQELHCSNFKKCK